MQSKNLISEIREYISAGNIEKAFDLLNKLKSEKKNFSDSIIHLTARFRRNEKSEQKGVISYDDFSRESNKINASFLHLIDAIEKDAPESFTDKDFENEALEKDEQLWKQEAKDGELDSLFITLNEIRQAKEKLISEEAKFYYQKRIKLIEDIIKESESEELSRIKKLLPRYGFKKKPSSTFVGIDFGTSNTLVSFLCYYEDNEEYITIPLEMQFPFQVPEWLEQFIVPSKIYYDEKEKKLLYGINAVNIPNLEKTEGINYWSSFKTKLGFDRGAEFFRSKLRYGSGIATILNAEDATEIFLKWLFNQIKSFVERNSLPKEIYYTVSIPTTYESNKRLSYINILKKIGINVSEHVLIDEPSAAFLSFIISLAEVEFNKLERKIILVFDFGGGTCDVTIIEFWEDKNGVYHSKKYGEDTINIGGDDIDLAIAEDVLYNIFISNEKSLENKIISDEDKKNILNALKDIAESLKIMICKTMKEDLSMSFDNSVFLLKQSEKFKFRRKDYNLKFIKLPYRQFNSIMEKFTSYNSKDSIFIPIEGALKKSDLKKEDIHYVLLIGGSCNNLYIQKAIEKYFQSSEILIPDNLQTHVSKGTAVNTALIYGQNKNIIDTIVSESISIKLFDGSQKVIIDAGTTVPSMYKEIRNFHINNANQTVIEIPIYAAGEKKILQNFQIKGEFNARDEFYIKIQIDANKIINIELFQKSFKRFLLFFNLPVEKLVETIRFPLASSSVLTPYRKEVNKLIKELNNYKANDENNSENRTTIDLVYKIAELHERHNNNKEALEVYLKYADKEYTNISYYASKSNNKELSKKYKKLAYENNQDGVSAYNYALEFSYKSDEYLSLMKEAAEKNHVSAQFKYGKMLIENKEIEKGNTYIQQAYKRLQDKFDNNPKHLQSWEYSNLMDIAKYLNDKDQLKKTEMIQQQIKEETDKDSQVENNKYFLSISTP